MSQSRESSLKDNQSARARTRIQPKPREIAPYCLLCAICKAFTVILIAIAILVLFLWLVFQPDNLRVSVDGAWLTRFDLDANNSLDYDLKLSVSLRNPNKKIGIHYERIHTVASYNGTIFGQRDFPRLHQRRKSTETLDVSFSGEASSVRSVVAESYERERGEGWLYMRVKMYTRVRLKVIVADSVVYEPDVDCYLRLPVPINGTAAKGFARTECDVQSFT